jgi:hypothetical protein
MNKPASVSLRSARGLFVLLWAVCLSCANSTPIIIGGDSGPSKDAKTGDGACGDIDEPCCAPPAQCTPGEFCNPEGICKNQHPKDVGHPCSSPSMCSSGICGYTQGLGDGGPAVPDGAPPPNCPQTGCTVECFNTMTDCLPGWKCDMLTLGEGVCTCTCAEETCDGQDNNCDGVIDNEPAASDWCTAQMFGIPQKCVKGACTCVDTCDDTCVDLQTDDNNCGKCNHACKMTVEKCNKGVCGCAYTECGTDCVNTMGSDNANCGGCGKTCDYQCTMGVCGPATIEVPDMEEIASIAIDSTNVYWLGTNTTSFGAEVEYCPLTGCTGGVPTILAKATSECSFSFCDDELNLGALAVSPATVYFADGLGHIEECPIAGCSMTPTQYSASADNEETYLAADGTKVYWANEDAETVYDCADGTSCASPALIQDIVSSSPQGMAVVSGSAFYWGATTPGSSFFENFTVYSAPVGGGAITAVCTAADFEEFGQLIVAGGFVYFVDTTGTIYSCPTTATGATATTYITDSNEPTALASDGTNLYWTDEGFGSSSSTPGGTIMKCALGATCAASTTLVKGVSEPTGVVVGATQVYWISTSEPSFTPVIQYFHK